MTGLGTGKPLIYFDELFPQFRQFIVQEAKEHTPGVEMEVCRDRDTLIQVLNWIGQCGNPPLSLWAYDHEQPLPGALAEILNRSYERGSRQRRQTLMEIETETTPHMSLEALISDAENKTDASNAVVFPVKEPDR